MVVSASVAGSAALGDVVPALGPLGVMSLELLGPSQPSSLGSASSPISWRRVQNEAELACSQVTTVERILHDTLASVHRNILRSTQVSLRKRKTTDPVSTRSVFLHAHLPSPCIWFLAGSLASANAIVLQAEVAHAMAVLAAEASTQEAAAARDGATLRIREAEDRVAVAELEASEWESQAEAEHSAALASAHADTEGLTLRITLLKGELEEERRAWETFEMEH
jgi:hypothetical protein